MIDYNKVKYLKLGVMFIWFSYNVMNTLFLNIDEVKEFPFVSILAFILSGVSLFVVLLNYWEGIFKEKIPLAKLLFSFFNVFVIGYIGKIMRALFLSFEGINYSLESTFNFVSSNFIFALIFVAFNYGFYSVLTEFVEIKEDEELNEDKVEEFIEKLNKDMDFIYKIHGAGFYNDYSFKTDYEVNNLYDLFIHQSQSPLMNLVKSIDLMKSKLVGIRELHPDLKKNVYQKCNEFILEYGHKYSSLSDIYHLDKGFEVILDDKAIYDKIKKQYIDGSEYLEIIIAEEIEKKEQMTLKIARELEEERIRKDKEIKEKTQLEIKSKIDFL